MARTVAIGSQDFSYLRENNYFYVDKTAFIREWWDADDPVTLITRPRRFGKTLTMSMLEHFFSSKYAGRHDLFEGLEVWKDERYRALQGTYPVIFLSFAGVKQTTFASAKSMINSLIANLFIQYEWLLSDERLTQKDREFYQHVSRDMDDTTAALSVNMLCEWLKRYYGKNCIILLDEYDTPLQEAYLNGYWDELSAYMRVFLNNTFKTNSALARGLMTGITRVSKESIFSDLNNLNVITTTSEEYAASFGFNEDEVFAAMDEQGIPEEEKARVKFWYDGFTFGSVRDIYNPWSIICYLDKKKYDTYWANTSGNELVSRLIMEGDKELKTAFESLLYGETIETMLDEQVVYSQLGKNRSAIWSLLLASGYLKVVHVTPGRTPRKSVYQLGLTNFEIKSLFESMFESWFSQTEDFNEFVRAMFRGNVRDMNRYMNKVALNTFSYFDTGSTPSEERQPERFYHGFVLGLLVDQADTHVVKSNRESGYGRYDVVMEPKDARGIAVIMEFKVYDPENGEKDIADTAASALRQIEDKRYDADLLARGIPSANILKYGFAFAGEKCLIVKG